MSNRPNCKAGYHRAYRPLPSSHGYGPRDDRQGNEIGSGRPKDYSILIPGKPYGLGTVGRDMKALSDLWRSKTITNVNEHVASKLQELTELKRAALKKEQYDTVLNIIARECALLGPESPSISKNLNLNINADDLTDEELAIIAAG
jgi:hypothetical protein